MKKILIFTVEAGGGHSSATQALKDYLHNDYEIVSLSFFKEVIKGIDPISLITLRNYSLDDWYNFFVRKRYNRVINLIAKMGLLVYPLFNVFVKKMVLRRVKKEKPNIIISVIPVVNGSIGEVAQTLNIPFIIVPTDLDTSWFTTNLSKKINQHCIFTFSFDDPILWQKLKNTNMAKKEIRVTGFPIKKRFFEPKDSHKIKREFSIPQEKPILMFLMGGMGSNSILNYLQEITTFEKPLHILVCFGKNEALRSKINTITLPEHLSISPIGFTNKIADLMAVADIVLTKSGSVSVCEALYMNVPLLLDCTGVALDWEVLNHEFIKKHHFGSLLTTYKDIVPILEKYFGTSDYREQIKKTIEQYPKEFFGKHIKEIIINL